MGLVPEVQDVAADEPVSESLCQPTQVPEVVGTHGGARLDLDPDDLPVAPFEDEVDLTSVAVPVEVQRGAEIAGGQQPGQFGMNECLDEDPGGGVARRTVEPPRSCRRDARNSDSRLTESPTEGCARR